MIAGLLVVGGYGSLIWCFGWVGLAAVALHVLLLLGASLMS